MRMAVELRKGRGVVFFCSISMICPQFPVSCVQRQNDEANIPLSHPSSQRTDRKSYS